MAARSEKHRKPTGVRQGQVRDYLAIEAARRYGPIEASLAPRLRRNIRRNFGVLLPLEIVAAQLEYYKSIYDSAAALLPRFLNPAAPGEYADPAHVRWEAFVGAIARRYPREARGRLGQIANVAIYYEYLR
jgi:hypothetical protein